MTDQELWTRKGIKAHAFDFSAMGLPFIALSIMHGADSDGFWWFFGWSLLCFAAGLLVALIRRELRQPQESSEDTDADLSPP